MRILVVGLGSMGKRRIRLLKQLDGTVEIVGVDTSPERRKEAEILHQIETAANLDEAFLRKKYDCAFVSTSPLSHAAIIEACLEQEMHVFTELNLTDKGYDRIAEIAEKKGLKVFISSTLLYNRQICAIKDQVVKAGCPLNYIYHVGQYLPDWHPWESYKDYFVAQKETNACREIFAIQLPWIVDVFGRIKLVTKLLKKSTKLEIDYDDTIYLQLEHENGTFGVFVCDVVSRRPTVSLEVFGEDIHVVWDGSPQGLKAYDFSTKELETLKSYEKTEHLEGYADTIIEDEYVDEIKAFLTWLNDGMAPRYMLEDDKYILSVIDSIEEK